MKFINDMKTNNSKILLADGLNIGCAQQSSIGYKDLTGIIGDVMRGVVRILPHAASVHFHIVHVNLNLFIILNSKQKEPSMHLRRLAILYLHVIENSLFKPWKKQ